MRGGGGRECGRNYGSRLGGRYGEVAVAGAKLAMELRNDN